MELQDALDKDTDGFRLAVMDNAELNQALDEACAAFSLTLKSIPEELFVGQDIVELEDPTVPPKGELLEEVIFN